MSEAANLNEARTSEEGSRSPLWVRIGLVGLAVAVALIPAAAIAVIALGIGAAMALSSIAGQDPTPAFLLGAAAAVATAATVGTAVHRGSRRATAHGQRVRAIWGLGLVATLATSTVTAAVKGEDRYRELAEPPARLATVTLPEDAQRLLTLLRDEDVPAVANWDQGVASMNVLAVNCCAWPGDPVALDAEDELTRLADGGSDLVALARDQEGRIVYVEFVNEAYFAEPSADWFFVVSGPPAARESLLTEVVDAMSQAAGPRRGSPLTPKGP